ncbi:MAG: HdeD family acid-resistance protein [Methylovirgula sp.]
MDPLTPSIPLPLPHASLGTLIERLRPRWGWFVALGALIVLLGVTALILVVSATIASVFAVAIFMIVAGGAEIVMGFSAHNWCRFFLWIIGGIAYIIVGAFAVAQPLMAAAAFTLVLGAGMLTMGVIRIFVASQLGKGVRWPSILAGTVTFVFGGIILIGWPTNSFIVLGLLLGLDLMFWGGSWIVLGLRLRAHL